MPPCSTLFPTRRSSDLRVLRAVPLDSRRDVPVSLLHPAAADARAVRARARRDADDAAGAKTRRGRRRRGDRRGVVLLLQAAEDRKSTRLNSSHANISYAPVLYTFPYTTLFRSSRTSCRSSGFTA